MQRLLSRVPWIVLLALAGCHAEVEEGRFACQFSDQCPDGWVCRDDARCWRTAIPPGPTRGDITPLGGTRTSNSGRLVLEDDGFDTSDRHCNGAGTVCASGAIGR